ncbi:MAG: FmdB family transcriptional regulator [Actinobacteria bacterium]|nr:FmdB family transcriptional regulator [Actinomycetota bacterium]MCG2800861.1 FmdB family transcriptional regulator [Cellulomonas sp.]
MPTYSYRCTVCDHAFDVHQSFTDDALTVCPNCEGRLRKVFSPVGVVFKGSGFYRTDARSSSRSASIPAAPASGGSSDGSGSSTPSTSAPAATSASTPSTSTTATPAKAAAAS